MKVLCGRWGGLQHLHVLDWLEWQITCEPHAQTDRCNGSSRSCGNCAN